MIDTVRKSDPQSPIDNKGQVSSPWISTIHEIQMCCSMMLDDVPSDSFEFGAPMDFPQTQFAFKRALDSDWR
jgi:hypothetical protein